MPSGSVSRTGACQRCHRRKVKCDRTRPSCVPCARINVQCTYAAREHQIQLRRQDVERLEQRIRDLQAENDNLTGRLAGLQQQSQQSATAAAADDRLATPNTTSSLGLQSEDTHASAGSGEIASQVIHLSLNAGGGRDFVGSTSGLFLANLLQSHSQSVGSSHHHVVCQHPSSTPRHLNRSGNLEANGVLNLPPKSLATEILDAYCSHDRLCYPFMSPKALDKALEAVYDGRNPEAADPVDGFLIDMTLAIGTAQVYKLNWNGIWDAEVHYNRAMTRLGDVLSRGGITALQALLLICQYRMGTTSHDTSTSVWHLIGVAARTCFELGLHKASTYASPSSPERSEGGTAAWQGDVETKRRCFWSVVSMDRIASLILGRPLAIQLEDIDVELPHFDTPASVPLHHSLSTASLGTPEWHLGTSIFVHIVRYRLICGKVLNLLHRSPGANRESTITYDDSRNALVEELRSWRAETANIPLIPADAPPASLASRSSFRSAEWYKLLYHNGILMLFRPSPTLCDATGNSTVLQHMFDSSQEAINLYANLHRSRKINYSWVTLHSIFIAGLSYIYALRNHLQHAQSRNLSTATPLKATLRSTPTISQVVNDTRACSKVLVAVSERWAMARNCSEVFDRLSDAVVADIVEAQTGRASVSSSSTLPVQSTGEAGRHMQVSSMELDEEEAAMFLPPSHGFVNMTVDETLRDCFGDLQNICYDQYHSDAIAQLSQDWLFGMGETPSRYF